MEKRRIKPLLLGLAVLLFGILAACGKEVQEPEAAAVNEDELFVISCIDVGKGDCILLEKGASHILIDCGYRDTAADVLSFLRGKGIEALDALIITHYDKDHVGGAALIADTLEIRETYLPDYEPDSKHYRSLMDVLDKKGMAYSCVSEDEQFSMEGVDYTIYASPLEYDPESNDGDGNDNNVSIILTAEYGEDSYLFAGDLEKKGIKAYLEGGHGNYDVVKMPHHGSLEKNSDEFILSTGVKYALITDSTEEPADEGLLQLLQAAEAEVYRSSVDGNIVLYGDGSGNYRVECEHGR